MTSASLEAARAVKVKLAAALEGRPELRGIGIVFRECGYGVKVNLSRPSDDIIIPSEMDGVAVIVEIVGTITAS